MTQPTLFDAVESGQARDEALVRAERNADAEWKAAALDAVRRTALESAYFTADDVWQKLTARPHEPRAMGAIMRQASLLEWIAPTDTFRPTAKISQHRQPIRVWKSLLHGEAR